MYGHRPQPRRKRTTQPVRVHRTLTIRLRTWDRARRLFSGRRRHLTVGGPTLERDAALTVAFVLPDGVRIALDARVVEVRDDSAMDLLIVGLDALAEGSGPIPVSELLRGNLRLRQLTRR